MLEMITIIICKDIEKQVVQAAHVLQKNPPKKAIPSQKATGGLLGIANSIGTFDLDMYLPNWGTKAQPCQELHYRCWWTRKLKSCENKNTEIISGDF
jgi:hypothetical protein